MRIFLLLPAVTLASLFSEHRQKYLNPNVDPCDNFYHHVCPENMENHLMIRPRIEMEYEEKITSYVSEEFLKYEKILQALTNASSPITKPRAIDDYVSDPLLQKICELTTFPCSESEADFIQMDFFVYGGSVITDRLFNAFNKVGRYEAFTRMAKDDDNYRKMAEEARKLFNLTQQKVVAEFEKTKWMQDPNHSHSHVSIINMTTLRILDETASFDMDEALIESFKNLLNCDGYESELLCTWQSITKFLDDFRTIAGQQTVDLVNFVNASKYNAQFVSMSSSPPYEFFVYQAPIFYDNVYDSLPEMLGSVHVTISHEIGHSAFKFDTATFPSTYQCFQNHTESVCAKYFGKENCPPGWQTYEEDGADWIALRVALDMFPELVANPTKNDYEEFFYAYASQNCGHTRPPPDNAHSDQIVRINGILRQIGEFASTFGCKKGDYMFLENENKCPPLIGKDAPSF